MKTKNSLLVKLWHRCGVFRLTRVRTRPLERHYLLGLLKIAQFFVFSTENKKKCRDRIKIKIGATNGKTKHLLCNQGCFQVNNITPFSNQFRKLATIRLAANDTTC